MTKPRLVLVPRWQRIVAANAIREPWLRAQALWNVGIKGYHTKKEICQVAEIEKLRTCVACPNNVPQLTIIHDCS